MPVWWMESSDDPYLAINEAPEEEAVHSSN